MQIAVERNLLQSEIPLGLPVKAMQLSVAIVSDAIRGRNGVGTYYPDLVQHLEPIVGRIQLVCPEDSGDTRLEAFSVPMPGDATQRMVWPKVGALYAQLDKLRPSVIVIPSIGAFSYFALRYAKSNRVPIALVNHTNFDQLLSLYWPKVLATPLESGLARVNRWLIRQASAVAAMNAEAFEHAQSVGAENIRVMGTPLAIEFLRPPLPDPPSELNSCLFVGRLAKEKGLECILQAASGLSDMRFTIVGDGPLRKRVERAAAKTPNLRYLGWIDRLHVRREIDDSQLLLLPSKLETFGTVALEALARRRFVLTSPECGIAKWPSLCRGLFQVGASETLTAAIRRLRFLSPPERSRHAEPSWNAVENFNDYTVRSWLKFLMDAAELDTVSGRRLTRSTTA
jgi:glycosyltransferase involved in cell wall biosynthesis